MGVTPPSVVSVAAVPLRLKATAAVSAVPDADAELLLLDGTPDVQVHLETAVDL